MELRELGRSGVRISPIGLGGYQLGPGPGDEPDAERAVQVLRTSLDAGVNWLDTSEAYLETNNETLIGAALTRADTGGELLVATKVAPGAGTTGGGSGFRREQVHAGCRASLRRLGRDHADVYYLHWPDRTGVVPLEETWGAMAELADDGLVRAIGLSNFDLEAIERCHAQRPVDTLQTGLSLLDYLEDRDLIARCGELGIGVTIYEPLCGGILGGKTADEILAFWTGPWRESPWFKRMLAPEPLEHSFAVVDGIRPIAARLGATVGQVAIAWVLRQPGVAAAIAGSSDGRHMAENAGAAKLDLTAVLAELEALIPLGPAFAVEA